jgi:probable rRNA maturation factor
MASVKPVRDVVIHITQNFKGIKISLPRLRKLVKTICSRFSRSDIQYEINIVIVEDAEFRGLNRRFLKRKTTSDCLSFDLSDDKQPDSSKLLEIIVNGELAVKQANSFGHPDEAELALYVTHGLLHQLGFNDSTPSKARKMHHIEDEILQQSGYGLVYNKSINAQERRKIKK